jgi:hypothetical protein
MAHIGINRHIGLILSECHCHKLLNLYSLCCHKRRVGACNDWMAAKNVV